MLSAFALLGASAAGAQETPPPSDVDVANMALVCVATYDLVISKQPDGPQAEAISGARDLARSIYIEASQSDEVTADDVSAALTRRWRRQSPAEKAISTNITRPATVC